MTDDVMPPISDRLKDAVDSGNTPDHLTDLLLDAAEEIDEMNALFQLHWDTTQRAVKRWQAANPGKDLVWPDATDLLVWLLDELESKSK